jgi:hypothetical protein
MVLGNQALPGAIPMEDMDLVMLPGTRQVEVNPANPNIAGSLAMARPCFSLSLWHGEHSPGIGIALWWWNGQEMRRATPW